MKYGKKKNSEMFVIRVIKGEEKDSVAETIFEEQKVQKFPKTI